MLTSPDSRGSRGARLAGLRFAVIAFSILILGPPASAQKFPKPTRPLFLPVNVPTTAANPFMDGQGLRVEWQRAVRIPDSFFYREVGRAGYFLFENRVGWTARSLGSPGSTVTYPGTTTFIGHDVVGSPDPSSPLHQFQVDDDHDWQSFDVAVPGGRATIWIFDDVNDVDDDDWLLGTAGLADSSLAPEGAGPDVIDDRGFIVRLNGDPTTDVHWLEGMPEPGDGGWDWASHHHLFGRSSFGQSLQAAGLDADPENAVDHEYYEIARHRPDWASGPASPDEWWDLAGAAAVPLHVAESKDGVPVQGDGPILVKHAAKVPAALWWLQHWDVGDVGIGVPADQDQADRIRAAYDDATAGAAAEAQPYLDAAAASLDAMLAALVDREYDVAYPHVMDVRRQLRKAEAKGFDELLVAQVKTQAVAFWFSVVAQHVRQLDETGGVADCASLAVSDRNLGKAHRAIYRFGTTLKKLAEKGDKGAGDVLGAVSRLKRIGKAVDKAQDFIADRVSTIEVDPELTRQTIVGWEATINEAGIISPDYDSYRDALFDLAVDDLGLNRVQLTVRSGAENATDHWTQYKDGVIDHDTWRAFRYATVDDNGDPFVLDPAGFHFGELDKMVVNIIEPWRARLAANGEQLFVNLTYVAFTDQITMGGGYHHDDPEEYAEFIEATWLHLQGTYGWVPDGLEVILEPDNVAQWSNGTAVGQGLVAAAERLAMHGFTPSITAPSNADMTKALQYYDEMATTVPEALDHITEIAYHRYAGSTETSLRSIADRGLALGVRTAMLEWWSSANDYRTFHKDLKLGRNSAWQQGVLLDPNPNTKAGFITVDLGDPAFPLSLGRMTVFTRQYTKYVRRDAVRIEARSNDPSLDPVAFVNADGRSVVVVKVECGGAFEIDGLPAGTYGAFYTTDSEYDVHLPDATIGKGEVVGVSIPATGVITVHAR